MRGLSLHLYLKSKQNTFLPSHLGQFFAGHRRFHRARGQLQHLRPSIMASERYSFSLTTFRYDCNGTFNLRLGKFLSISDGVLALPTSWSHIGKVPMPKGKVCYPGTLLYEFSWFYKIFLHKTRSLKYSENFVVEPSPKNWSHVFISHFFEQKNPTNFNL